ncbi:uncharacterized protein LOC115349859 [Aquila chrysaetos chrysaetos]|uniref:uncharacterized protein LOC115349859 n=1 Tax=Aquila chrysaetos chrysaetos TaxID=223781 RepID=UPI00117702BE|nr:uncharacterized protein LOC115349859 [Aquila chrysaetos chrysaetos]
MFWGRSLWSLLTTGSLLATGRPGALVGDPPPTSPVSPTHYPFSRAGLAMSHVSRPAFSGAKGPEGHPQQSQPLGHPLGVAAGLSMGTGDAAESVIDPDMVALFEDFLGKDVSEEVTMSSAGAHPLAKPYHYVVRDTEQNGLCLHNGRLVATRLQGANAAQEEPISVVPNQYLERRRCPLIVGIRGGTQALSCGTGPEPQLKLEVSVP